ncbi:MAG: Nramp family divalent metal transporter [Planctomycetaceae bacterium]|nr:Nramp family divalent metal transporter [Planctomycetaceae bacterium]
MDSPDRVTKQEELVPDSVIPHQTLPPLRYRDLPEAPRWTSLVGPSVILAGLALGSGEFVFWPYITYRTGFIFFWACMLGVFTQFYINMEIERWTLATGESAITGFSRLSRHWAWVFLILNIVPWVWPGWATGAGTLMNWVLLGAEEKPIEIRQELPANTLPSAIPASISDDLSIERSPEKAEIVWKGPLSDQQLDELNSLNDSEQFQQAISELRFKVRTKGGIDYAAPYSAIFAILSLWIIGIALTMGPVVYNTVERLQTILVLMIFVIAIVVGAFVIRPDAVVAMSKGMVSFGSMPDELSGLSLMALLGAVAFAGAGGTMNLGQSNFIRDKGYGMGKYVGRITSPLTGQEEAVLDVGFHFKHTPENQRRWKEWWKAANLEHLFSFLMTCVVCLVLLSLISYSLFYDNSGNLKPGMERFGTDMNFIWGEADQLRTMWVNPWLGGFIRIGFLVMGFCLLLTTELGVLDASARISTDIIKVNFLRDNRRWTQSRLYFTLLWGTIGVSTLILGYGMVEPSLKQPMFLLKMSAAMNGGVMFIYSVLLLYLNTKILSRSLAVSPSRFLAMIWASAFYGYFTLLALQSDVIPWLGSLMTGK